VLSGVLMAAAVAATVGILPTDTTTQIAVAALAAVLVGVIAYLVSIAVLGVPISLRVAARRRTAVDAPSP
jgi:hypothetical protein